MCCSDRCSVNICGCFGIQTALIFGALIGILFAFGLIPGIIFAIWIAFGLAVLSLIFLIAGVFIAASDKAKVLEKCLRKNISCLLAGIIGTIIIAIALLSITIVVTNLIAAIVALGAFFFALLIIGLISFISCIIDRLNNCD
jgi:hypothetical protein